MLPTTDTAAPIDTLFRAFQKFFKLEAASGIVLLACAVAALAWANSPSGQTISTMPLAASSLKNF